MIAIKGMEMPKCCAECDLCRGHICKITGIDIIANPKGNCPLVEIVTCKDCKNYLHIDGHDHLDYCDKHGCVSGNHFCADAERRE